MKSGIYRIVNAISGRAYIGKSTNLAVRFMTHRSQLRSGHHHCADLQADWDALGEQSFEFVVHAECSSSEMGAAECALIAIERAEGRCYNARAGTPTDGRPPLPDEERLARRSIRMTRSQWAFIDAMGPARFREKIDGWDGTAPIEDQVAYWAEP